MKNSRIRDALINLTESLSDIDDCAVILSDGLVVTSKIVHDIDEERLRTISASLFGMASIAAKQFEKDEAQYVLIKCSKNYIALFKAGDNAVLVVDFNADADLKAILNKCVDSASVIKDLV